ncbi:MAG: hypothetical protein WCT49_03820 [Candidatus Paceibacterota bacterium]|jgi:hypothetical protein|nr:hypothetical protein [Candidatus Paceibacterota bacterium]
MAKPKIQPKSKYVKNYFASKNIDEKTLKIRAEEFLASGTPASYVTQVALALILLSGAAVLGAVAPGLTVAARGYQRAKGYSNRDFASAAGNLKRGGYIEEFLSADDVPRVRLTKKGEAYFQKILFDDVELPEPKKWGGKWTFVLFDIPVQHKKAREALRWRLKALGFFQYQKSVWVYPHPCEKEILYVADYFGVGKFVEILSVDHLTKDEELKKHFEMK